MSQERRVGEREDGEGEETAAHTAHTADHDKGEG